MGTACKMFARLALGTAAAGVGSIAAAKCLSLDEAKGLADAIDNGVTAQTAITSTAFSLGLLNGKKTPMDASDIKSLKQAKDEVSFLRFMAWDAAQTAVSPADPKDEAGVFKYVNYTECPQFTSKHKSLMSKVVTPELFEKLKNVKTSKGFTLSNAIQTGVKTPHLGVGAVAGDEESWEIFKELYYPIIKGWHGYDAEKEFHKVDLNPDNLEFTPQQLNLFNKYVASTRIRAARNVSGFALPAGTTPEERAGVEKVLTEAFAGMTGELKGTYYPLGGMTKEQEDNLQSNGFLFQKPSVRNLLTMAGAARQWPNNRGIYHNDQKTALCWCNEEDHCRIISMSKDGDVKAVFRRFCNLSNALKASAVANGTKLMYSDRLGFLGTCPSNLGTGLRGSVMVKLENFNKNVELLEEVCDAFDLQPRGSAGEHSAAVGAKFDVSNKQRLGFSEVELVQKMINGVTKVIALEEKLASGQSLVKGVDY